MALFHSDSLVIQMLQVEYIRRYVIVFYVIGHFSLKSKVCKKDNSLNILDKLFVEMPLF
jgi:hypothetical protein